MDLRTYAILLGLLSEVALTTDQGTPDFDKIASITGHTRDTVKVYLAPGAEFPRWLKLMNYVGEKINSKLPEGSVGRILKERREQLTKHDRSIQHDVMYNNHYQLSEAASLLCWVDQEDYGNEIIAPVNWDQKLFEVMMINFLKTLKIN